MNKFKILLCPLLVFIILFFLGVGVVDDFGITWDEPVHFASGDLYLNRVLDNGGFSFSDSDFRGAMQFYGPVFDIWGAINNRIFSEKLGILAPDNARHIHIIICGVLTVIFTYLLAQKAGSTRVAVFAALFLLAFPRFLGHSFNNPKDIPLSAVFVISIYFYYLRLTTGKRKFSLILAILGGIGFATRFQYVIFPVLIFAYTIIYICLKYDNKQEIVKKLISLWDLLAAILMSIPIGIGFWPYFWSDTLLKLKRMVEFYLYHRSQARLLILYFGKDYIPGYNMPWHYAPVMLAITTPLITMGFFLLGMLRIIVLWLRPSNGKNRNRRLFVILPILWILIGIIPFILPGQRVYGGIRHFLFITPAFCLIAALGLDGLIRRIEKRIRAWYYPIIFLIFSILFFRVYSYHPYYTTYYNQLVGGPKGAFRRFGLENWGNSYKTACGYINENAEPGSTVLALLIPDIPRFYLRPDIKVLGPEDVYFPSTNYDYSIYIVRDMDLLKNDDKEPVFEILVKDQPICKVHKWR